MRSISPLSQQESSSSPGMRNFQVVVGVISLVVATLMVVRLPARSASAGGRHRLPPGHGSGATATAVLDDGPPTEVPLLGSGAGASTSGGSPIRRLINKIRNAWESGSLWVAGVIGFITGGVPVDGALIVLTLVVTSGAGVGTQFAAAIAFIVVMLVVVEIILVSYVVSPSRTLAVLKPLHEWAWKHRMKLVAAMFAITGASLLANAAGLM